MNTFITSFDYEGWYVFTDSSGRSTKGRISATLRLTNHYNLMIHDGRENVFDIEISNISSAKKVKFDWATESFIQFEFPLKQEVRFYCFIQEKTDELVDKFYELKRKQEKEDEAREGIVQEMIKDYLEIAVDECRRKHSLWISNWGKDLFDKIHKEVHTLSPRNIPHTKEECTLLIRERIEQAIMNKELPGSIDPKGDQYYYDNYQNISMTTR